MKLHYLLCAALAWPFVANASLTATTNSTGPTYTLTDLNTGDGIASSLVWKGYTGGQFGFPNGSAVLNTSGQAGMVQVTNLLPGIGTDGQYAIASNWGSELLQQVNDGYFANSSGLNASGVAMSTSLDQQFPAARATAGAYYRGVFELSPYTQVTFELPYAFEFTGDQNDLFGVLTQPGCCQDGYVYFTALMSNTGSNLGLDNRCLPACDTSRSGVLTYTVTNNRATSYTYSFSASLEQGISAPVPEPGTWAMLLAGLGLVGVAARRRRG